MKPLQPPAQNQPAVQPVHARLVALGRAIRKRLFRPEFSCGECDRWQRCGRAPGEECIARLEQIADDPLGYKRRMRARAALLKSGIAG